jgi:hypothetical protein
MYTQISEGLGQDDDLLRRLWFDVVKAREEIDLLRRKDALVKARQQIYFERDLLSELRKKFTDPDDPGLHQRRLRLRRLFKSVPPTRAQALYDRLKVRRRDDELSRAFHYRLATPTRKEMLRILRRTIRASRSRSKARAPKQRTKTSIDLAHAMERNRFWGQKLGWWKNRAKLALILSSSLGWILVSNERELVKAVALWQRDQGLKADGIIGPDTWRRMCAVMPGLGCR